MNDRRTRVLAAGGLFAVLVAFYALTFSFRAITDTDLNSLQTRSFVLHGDIDLSRYERIPGLRQQYENIDGHTYSIYGVGTTLVAVPVYLPLIHLGASEHFLQGAVGILYAAGAAVVLRHVLRRLFSPAIAAAGTIVFAFGTTMWTVGAMAFFPQAPVVFFECLGLAGMFSRREDGPALAGLGFGVATFIRPTAAIPLALVGALYVTLGRRTLLRYIAGAAVPLAGLAIQNYWVWGKWLTGGYWTAEVGFNADVPHALWGLTFGLWRGLFVYSPVLLVAVAGFVLAFRNARGFVERRLLVLGATSIVTIVLYARFTTWWNGLNQFGYRYLLEVVPFLIVIGAYAVATRPRLHVPAMGLGILSILTMTWGAAPSRGGFDGLLFASKLNETSLGNAWIVFLDHPLQGLARLTGVAAMSAFIVAISSRRRPKDETEAVERVRAMV
jgi:hypothetical protein